MRIGRSVDVLVVGAGPVGMMTALALAEKNHKIAIVDKSWRTSSQSYALALHPSTVRFLRERGLVHEALRGAHPVTEVAIYHSMAARAGTVLPIGGGGGFPLLVLPQNEFESALEGELEKRGVRVRWNHRAAAISEDGKGVSVLVEELEKYTGGYSVATMEWVVSRARHVHAQYLVGADGHRSIVRRHLDADYREAGRSELFAVFEFESDRPADSAMSLVLTEETSNVLWPLGGHRWRWSFELQGEHDFAEEREKHRVSMHFGDECFPALDAGALTSFIAARAPWFDASVEQVHWSLAVRFERKLARPVGARRCWMVGDAVHLTGPAGVQSMNAGLAEALELSGAISEALRGRGTDALEGYARGTEAEWRRLLGLERRFRPGAVTPPWIRKNWDRILPALPGHREDLDRLAGALGYVDRPPDIGDQGGLDVDRHPLESR